MSEELTEDERLTLSMCGSAAEKALRIIDQLTRERDGIDFAGQANVRAWRAEVARLKEALAAAERECCCGDNFESVAGPHDCAAGSGAVNQPAAPATRQIRDLGSLDIADGLDEPAAPTRTETQLLIEADERQVARVSRIESGMFVDEQGNRHNSFSAAQPAAPGRTENWTSCPVCGARVIESEWTKHMNGHAAPTRTDAEKRVLDAMASIPENVICDWTTHVSDWPRRIAKAELARREAKKQDKED